MGQYIMQHLLQAENAFELSFLIDRQLGTPVLIHPGQHVSKQFRTFRPEHRRGREAEYAVILLQLLRDFLDDGRDIVRRLGDDFLLAVPEMDKAVAQFGENVEILQIALDYGVIPGSNPGIGPERNVLGPSGDFIQLFSIFVKAAIKRSALV